MNELETLKTELEELNKRRAQIKQRIEWIEDQQTRAEIIAAGFDPDKQYRVDRAYQQWYRENVHPSGGASGFCDHLFTIEWVSDDRAYVKSIEKYGATCASVPQRFISEAVQP